MRPAKRGLLRRPRGAGRSFALLIDSSIRRRVGAQREQLALAHDFAGDFDRLGDEVENLFVHGLAIAGDEEEVERGAIGLADEKHGWDAAAEAAYGASAV